VDVQRSQSGEAAVRAGRLAAAGTLVSAVLVAGHCLPAIGVLIFGTTIGALSAFDALGTYRPCFIATGLGLWGYGFYLTYLRPTGDESTGAAASARPLLRTQALLWVSLAVLGIATVLPQVASYLAG